ncbi:MAG: hypothetical protein CL591_02245 [Alteromonas sp.]|nr:hypothetical protein [Alteromonas sp.]|tara:strand:- start:6241 stop:7050 length:810 start_codon:yes stop_codon:yes gene_type:complete
MAECNTQYKEHYFVGWDVGGWNCARNRNSRDALVILNCRNQIVGTPWRGNLSPTINSTSSQAEFIKSLFSLCKTEYTVGHITLAIDTPLGFSTYFHGLLTGTFADCDTANALNPYLFRYTERFLAEWGYTPLSPIKDMIGSQATKGIHTLAKFVPNIRQAGVWQSGDITAIEAYPSPCAHSAIMNKLQKSAGLEWCINDIGEEQLVDHRLPTQDHIDAFICALIAKLFAEQPEVLRFPDEAAPEQEGWIFLPKDCFDENNRKEKFLVSR